MSKSSLKNRVVTNTELKIDLLRSHDRMTKLFDPKTSVPELELHTNKQPFLHNIVVFVGKMSMGYNAKQC